ncbi:hypothetical protein NMG60_11005344 [Bertholletia excelsa]
MDEKREMGFSSSSSFTSDLFGSKEPSASSSLGIFGSIFAPSSKEIGKKSFHSNGIEKKEGSASEVSSNKTAETSPLSSEGEHQSTSNKYKGPFYQEQRVQPCHLSSSIYYGGQDIYSHPQSVQGSSYSTYNKDGSEDDTGIASRGNWWQGSLYY